MFEIAVVNEPSMFEPLKFYCITVFISLCYLISSLLIVITIITVVIIIMLIITILM